MSGSSDVFAARCPAAFAVFEQGRDKGLHRALQLTVSLRGERILEVAVGDAVPRTPLTTDHWLPWLSAGKPLTAVLILQLVERHELALDDPVMRFVPEFGQEHKATVTLRHLLTHTAGIRTADTGWPEATWETTIARLCAAPLDADATPGRTAGYHVASSWFLLGEVLQRVHQRSFAAILHDELFVPCGMDETRVLLQPAEWPTYESRLAPLWERMQGELQLTDWHRPPRLTQPSPGSSTRGPIRDLATFYEMLLADGAGRHGPVLQPATVHQMITRQRVGQFDQTLGHIIDFGLGVIVNSNRYGPDTVPYGYGRFASDETFGHGGAQSSQGYADPERQLVVAYVFNGRCGEPQHNRRCRQFNEALSRDLQAW